MQAEANQSITPNHSPEERGESGGRVEELDLRWRDAECCCCCCCREGRVGMRPETGTRKKRKAAATASERAPATSTKARRTELRRASPPTTQKRISRPPPSTWRICTHDTRPLSTCRTSWKDDTRANFVQPACVSADAAA